MKRLLIRIVDYHGRINASALWLGRQVSWVFMGAMVVIMLIQVFFRYVLNSALPWPEEAARMLMIWMMALTAPSAYRWGGFVSITMISDALPQKIRHLLEILTFVLAGIVLFVLFTQAIKHFNSGFIFKSSSLKIQLAWVYLSMSVCFGLLTSVNLELLTRALGRIFDNTDDFAAPAAPSIGGAE
jgi:TRAP-type C4-dicarboxylate transport system permease small subunit